jgi:hypothetical protein
MMRFHRIITKRTQTAIVMIAIKIAMNTACQVKTLTKEPNNGMALVTDANMLVFVSCHGVKNMITKQNNTLVCVKKELYSYVYVVNIVKKNNQRMTF